MEARPIEEWHEDMGDKLWWCLRDGKWLDEAPYVGHPLDCGLTVECHTHAAQPAARFNVGGWPGYHTHFTDIPAQPTAPTSSSGLSRGSTGPSFKRGDRVQRRDHAAGRPPAYRFRGTVCGEYDNPATGERGYNVSLAHDPGCIQNFPGYMLEPWSGDDGR